MKKQVIAVVLAMSVSMINNLVAYADDNVSYESECSDISYTNKFNIFIGTTLTQDDLKVTGLPDGVDVVPFSVTFTKAGGHEEIFSLTDGRRLTYHVYVEDNSSPFGYATYEHEVKIKVGDKVTLDTLNIRTPRGVSAEPFEKTYDKIGKYEEEFKTDDGEVYSFTVYVETAGKFEIVGAKNITVTEGAKIDILSGVQATRKAILELSDYDETLVDVPQIVTIKATDDDENVVKKKIKLFIKHKAVKKANKHVYMRCNVNMHKLPAYRSKNLGIIPYNKKVKVNGVVKVGKFKWYRTKYKNKTSYIFVNATSSKKLPKIDFKPNPNGKIGVMTDADYEFEDRQSYEDMREGGLIDHNGMYMNTICME